MIESIGYFFEFLGVNLASPQRSFFLSAGIGIVLPLFSLVFVRVAGGQKPGIVDFIVKGDLTLASIALVTTVLLESVKTVFFGSLLNNQTVRDQNVVIGALVFLFILLLANALLYATVVSRYSDIEIYNKNLLDRAANQGYQIQAEDISTPKIYYQVRIGLIAVLLCVLAVITGWQLSERGIS